MQGGNVRRKRRSDGARKHGPATPPEAAKPEERTYFEVIHALTLDPTVSYGAKNFWHFLRHNADGSTSKCWWGRDRIAEELRCSHGSIENWTKELRPEWLDYSDTFSRRFRKPKDPSVPRRVTRRTYLVRDGACFPYYHPARRFKIQPKEKQFPPKKQAENSPPKKRAENFPPKKSQSSARKLGGIQPKNRAVTEESKNEVTSLRFVKHSTQPSSSPTAHPAFAPLTRLAANADGAQGSPGSPEAGKNHEPETMNPHQLIEATSINDHASIQRAFAALKNEPDQPAFPGESQGETLSAWQAVAKIYSRGQSEQRDADFAEWKRQMLAWADSDNNSTPTQETKHA